MRTVSTNKLFQLVLVASVAFLSGCAMCANPFDCDYAAYGSRLPRADMAHGRVGSILDGSSAGVVSTQPIYDEGAYYGGEIISNGSVTDGTIISEGTVVNEGNGGYGESQPYESGSGEIYQSPMTQEQQSYQSLPAQDQIERVYETIEGEIGSN